MQSGNQVSQPGVTVILECSLGPGFRLQIILMYWSSMDQDNKTEFGLGEVLVARVKLFHCPGATSSKARPPLFFILDIGHRTHNILQL